MKKLVIIKNSVVKIQNLIMNHESRFVKSNLVWPCIEYCCHVWAGGPSCYMELLDNQKNGYAGLLVLHLLPLLNPWLIIEM